MERRVPMTPSGYETVKAELERLKSEERPKNVKEIEAALEHGDLSENAEYHAAKDQQGLNEARVAEIEEKIGRAEIIDPSKLNGKRIMFGATVTLVDEDTDEKKVYMIVGDFEADVKDGKISISSPIARSLIGKTVGDTVEVNTPGGGKSYEILKVRYQ